MSGSYYVDSSNRGNVNELLDQAELYRDQALGYANDAATSATGADTSEANAQSSATNAAASASAASASQANAAASASAAASSAANASAFSSSASSFATDAGIARDAAVVAKNDAQTAATNAAASATDAANVLSTSLLKANNLSDLPSVAVAKTNLGLNNVDNTSDANKPISTAQDAGLVSKDSSTGAASIPSGTTAQRPASPQLGMFRHNTSLNIFEGYNSGNWGLVGGDVVGPASATDNTLVRFDSTTGKLVKNSSAILNDSGGLSVSALQVGQSGTSSNNFHWRNNLLGGLRLSRGNEGSITGGDDPSDVIRIRNSNAVEFPGGVADGVLGAGQTWQVVTGSRAAGVTYTNTTVRPIFVIPSLQHGGGVFFNATFTISGVTVASMNSGNATYSASCPYGFVVPAGSTYRLDITAGGGILNYWAELR